MDSDDLFEQDAINALLPEIDDNSPEVERWLHKVAAPAYDRMKDDPSRGIPAQQVLANIEARLRARS
jgi:antitoxin ParD1/3/4